MLLTKGKVTELNERGFIIDRETQMETMTDGRELDLAVGEEVNITDALIKDGKVVSSSGTSVYRSGEWIKFIDAPRLFAGILRNKSNDFSFGVGSDTFPQTNSILVSFDRSEDGGASIHTLERSRDGTWNHICADAFPPPRKPRKLRKPRKPNLWLIAVVSGIVILVIALTGGVLLRFMFQ